MKNGPVVVIGAGAVGLCCALALRERGLAVTLLERGLPGGANSTLTGGGIRQQFGTETNLVLSKLAAPFWDGFKDRFGVDILFRKTGYLFLAKDSGDVTTLLANVALQNGMGVDSDYLDGIEIGRRWPALGARGFLGAAFRQADGWANQQRIIDGLVRGALVAAVDLRVGTECIEVERQAGGPMMVRTTDGAIEADAVVLATGPWMGVLERLGMAMPVIGRRHELLIVEPAEPLPPTLPWLIGMKDEVHLRPDAPGRALVGGFLGHDDPADPDDYERRANSRWTKDVLLACETVFGVVDRRAVVHRGWAGLYPGTPDRHPIIDRLGDGLFCALGFSGTGLMHAPAAGMLMAELIVDGTLRSANAAALAANRFSDERGPSSEKTGF